MHCGRCGATNQPTARFCHSCGAQLSGATLPLGVSVQGRYTILGLLGQGGMGAVYQVADARLGGKIMALKELSDAAITSPQVKTGAAAAFAREAQLLANLDHPNIPKVTDFFTETGKYYLVMEFVEGETLEARLARQGAPVSEADARDWALQLCDVLTYLHGRNPPVIFRDLKPANIMLTPQGQIKLVDFGIARLFNPMKAGDTFVIGTPGYAPREQYGKEQTDARSDIYSLGVVLHTLLTQYDPAATPFRLPPVRQINPAVSTQMEAVIDKATQMDPSQRYQDAAQMKAALSSHTVAAAPGLSGFLRRWRWNMFAGVLLVAMIGTAITAVALGSRDRAGWTPVPATAVARAVTSETPTAGASPSPESGASASAAGLTPGGLTSVTPRPTATQLPPTATFSPTVTPTATPSPTMTSPPPTATPKPTATPSLTATRPPPTATPRPTATRPPPTATPQPTATLPPPTATPRPTATRPPPTATPRPTATRPPPTATLRPTATRPPPTATPRPTATRPPPTATPRPIATRPPPTATPRPTATRPPPTATPRPTAICARAVDSQFAGIWDRSLLGCAIGPSNIVWAAWQPFQGGYMMWRSDLNTVYVLFSDGGWIEIPDKWDGYSTAGRGEPPPGLRAPERGFGWVWGTRDDVFNRLGWALDQEKGFCTAVQPMERGYVFQSSRVQSCQDGLYNWATNPEFRSLLFRVMTNGTWRLF